MSVHDVLVFNVIGSSRLLISGGQKKTPVFSVLNWIISVCDQYAHGYCGDTHSVDVFDYGQVVTQKNLNSIHDDVELLIICGRGIILVLNESGLKLDI